MAEVNQNCDPDGWLGDAHASAYLEQTETINADCR